jgi:hypothetical protein
MAFDEQKCDGAGEVPIHQARRWGRSNADLKFVPTPGVVLPEDSYAPEEARHAPPGADENKFQREFHLLT